MASTHTGRQLSAVLRFALMQYHITQQQLWLKQRLTGMVQTVGLTSEVYQYDAVRAQWHGHASWQMQRHRIVFPTHDALTNFERQLQDRMRYLSYERLARHVRTDGTATTLALTLGVAGVPTDIVVLIQPHLPAVPPTPDAIPPAFATVPATPARIAIVIDDIGWDVAIAKALLDLDIPLSFAIIPQSPYLTHIVAAAQRHGCEVLLHLPMEPHNYPQVNPGKDALFSHMSPHELSAHLHAALQMLPTAIGVNNHMGSRLTEDSQAMQVIMRELKQYNLFFLDSRTSSASQAYRIAREVGLKTAQRNVFLDHDTRPEQIVQQLHRLATLAQRHGYAIGIGHPYPETLHALKQALPTLRRAGIAIVPVSHLVQ